jgi:6-phosphogluconolactonase
MDTRLHMEDTPTGASVAVLPDAASLVEAAADIIVEEARRAVDEKRRFSLALAGGSTPRPVYRLLAAPPFAGEMPWRQTEVFWGDERCVEPTDPRSNERMVREALLDHVPIPPEQVHPMRCTGLGVAGAGGAVRYGEAVARRAADDYERLLQSYFAGGGAADGGSSGGGAAAPATADATAQAPGLDLVLLGMGDNGHTASLFPGSTVLDEQERWVAAAQEDPQTAMTTSGTGERLWRVTLTVPFIDRAALVLFVVSGASKAMAVKGALQGGADPHSLPALAIRPPEGRLWWLLDRAAASGLQTRRPWGRTIS